MTFERATLGRTGLEVGRLGVGASYGVPAAAVERAFEEGVNYLYWGSWRRPAFAQAIRNLASRRERMALVIQSYSRVPRLVGWSLERALREVRLDYADVLLLGLWNPRVAHFQRRPGQSRCPIWTRRTKLKLRILPPAKRLIWEKLM